MIDDADAFWSDGDGQYTVSCYTDHVERFRLEVTATGARFVLERATNVH